MPRRLSLVVGFVSLFAGCSESQDPVQPIPEPEPGFATEGFSFLAPLTDVVPANGQLIPTVAVTVDAYRLENPCTGTGLVETFSSESLGPARCRWTRRRTASSSSGRRRNRT